MNGTIHLDRIKNHPIRLRLRLPAVLATAISALAFPLFARAQTSADSTTVALDELTVVSRRPMQDIGMQKTSFDSIALKDNIALSMADILTFNSSVFVKSSGRASLSTIAFRGTSPSHTKVSWNGLPVNNPMLGMTDFSSIPSFFVDKASLLHGTSSVAESGGGLGGAVSLATAPEFDKGFGAQYIQGIGSYKTFDEFLKMSFSNRHWSFSTRVANSSSANDYTYINHDKKLNIYDEDHNIISQYHPKEKNRLGAFKDFNVLQEINYDNRRGDRAMINVWFTSDNREIPMLSTDYSDPLGIENRQKDKSLRAVTGWRHICSTWNIDLRAGYIHSRTAYDYSREKTDHTWSSLTHSRNTANTFHANAEANFQPSERWFFTLSATANHHDVHSSDRKLAAGTGADVDIGYHQLRFESSEALSARWQPLDGLGLAATLREETYGNHATPLIPAIFFDWKPLNAYAGNTLLGLILKASGSRNYRSPSLNDLYFMPGGNPDLKSEHGLSYDCGFSFTAVRDGRFNAALSASWFDSHIDDWIIWLPTFKGFFTPRNMKSVHAYGVEINGHASCSPWKDWRFDIHASYSWTPSVNVGEKISEGDKSIGKQLPYIPLHSASASLRASWRSWGLRYQWHIYSERFTMTSNASSLTGRLPAYSLSNLSFEKNLRVRPVDVKLKLAVNNLFNADYMSILSRPMPGTNFEAFVALIY